MTALLGGLPRERARRGKRRRDGRGCKRGGTSPSFIPAVYKQTFPFFPLQPSLSEYVPLPQFFFFIFIIGRVERRGGADLN